MTPRGRSFSRPSFVHSTVVFSALPARGLFAARKGMARALRVIEIASEKVRWRFISLSLMLGRRGGRKMLEHFIHAFVEVLCVFVRLVGGRIAGLASPDHFLRCVI